MLVFFLHIHVHILQNKEPVRQNDLFKPIFFFGMSNSISNLKEKETVR
jgi:hypothetical protein